MSTTVAHRFSLLAGQVYGMSMFPGYMDAPYHSPVIVRAVMPRGDRRFELDFVNIGYAAGVQCLQISFRTLHRGSAYLAALREEGPDRTCIFVPMNRPWLEMHFSELRDTERLFDDSGRPVPAVFEELMA